MKLSQTKTFSGKTFDFENFSKEDIRLDDICHHLSLICRFGGAIDRFYSVLDHSLFCDDIWCSTKIDENVRDYDLLRMRVLLLLHDAHEAYTGDVIRPLKALIPGIDVIQANLDDCIFRSFGIKPPSDSERKQIREIDDIALVSEARLYMPLNAYNDIRGVVKAKPCFEVLPVPNADDGLTLFRDRLLYVIDQLKEIDDETKNGLRS